MAVLLFDGMCNLCNGAVQFILRHERKGRGDGLELRFASLQSEAGRNLLITTAGPVQAALILQDAQPEVGPSTLVYIDAGVAYTKSKAVLGSAKHLRIPWRWVRIGVVLPRCLRDWMYDAVARRRLRWFGRSETCPIPTAAQRDRFLD